MLSQNVEKNSTKQVMVYPSGVHKSDRMHLMHRWILFFFHFQYMFYLRFYFIYILSLLLMFCFGFHIIRPIQENITLNNALDMCTQAYTQTHTQHTHARRETRIHMHAHMHYTYVQRLSFCPLYCAV